MRLVLLSMLLTMSLPHPVPDTCCPTTRLQIGPSSERYNHFSYPMSAVPGQWCKYAHIISPVPQGMRRAIVTLRGRDHRNRRGHHGTRFMCAELSFVAAGPRFEELHTWSDFWVTFTKKGQEMAAFIQRAASINETSHTHPTGFRRAISYAPRGGRDSGLEQLLAG